MPEIEIDGRVFTISGAEAEKEKGDKVMPKLKRESITIIFSWVGIAIGVLTALAGLLTDVLEDWDTLTLAGVITIFYNAVMHVMRLKTSRPIEGTVAARMAPRERR